MEPGLVTEKHYSVGQNLWESSAELVLVFRCVMGLLLRCQREGKEPATVIRRVRTGIGNKALALLCSPFHLAHLPSVSYGQKLTKRPLSRESEKCMQFSDFQPQCHKAEHGDSDIVTLTYVRAYVSVTDRESEKCMQFSEIQPQCHKAEHRRCGLGQRQLINKWNIYSEV